MLKRLLVFWVIELRLSTLKMEEKEKEKKKKEKEKEKEEEKEKGKEKEKRYECLDTHHFCYQPYSST